MTLRNSSVLFLSASLNFLLGKALRNSSWRCLVENLKVLGSFRSPSFRNLCINGCIRGQRTYPNPKVSTGGAKSARFRSGKGYRDTEVQEIAESNTCHGEP